MKTLRYLLIILIVGSLLPSCKKTMVTPGVASLNIIDASTDVPTVAVNFVIPPIPFYQQQALISYGSSAEYGQTSGSVPLTLVSSNDTTHHIYQGTLNLTSTKIYSLYIYGNLPNISTLLLQDDIPVHKDSVSGARFINLSADVGAINISLQSNTNNEFSNIAYKNITAFKSYSNTSAVMSNGGYNFNVFNLSGNILATFNWNPQIFQNNTLVFSGNNNTGYEVFQVNNY